MPLRVRGVYITVLAILIILSIASIVYSTTLYTGKTQYVEGSMGHDSNPYFYYFIHITDLHLGSNLCDKKKLEIFANDVKNVYAALPIRPFPARGSSPLI